MTIYNPLVLALLLIAASPLGAQTSARTTDAPNYMNYAADPLQKIYSAALLGFAHETKCQFLAQSDRDNYERRLDRVNYFFQGYVLAQGMAKNPEDAVKYPKAMAVGAIRFAAARPCDAEARKSVSQGLQLAKEFDEEIRKSSKQ